MVRDKKPKKPNTLSRWFGNQKTSYIIIIIVTILLVIAGFFLHRKLQNTKLELESCRSSCSNDSQA